MDFVQIYFKKFNEIAVISNFLAFFCFYLTFFNLLDPDPQPSPPPPHNPPVLAVPGVPWGQNTGLVAPIILSLFLSLSLWLCPFDIVLPFQAK